MDSYQGQAKTVLGSDADVNQRPPAPRQKFVHFALKNIDNELNEFKTTRFDERHKNNAAALNLTNNSESEGVPSSSELYLRLNQAQLFHCHTIPRKPMERPTRIDYQARNNNSTLSNYLELVGANTPIQYPPRVSSPPINRDPPPPPRLERLPTPDFEDTCDDRPKFCECLGCYEVERSIHIVESRREALAYSKMEDQYQAATAYIKNARPVSRQQRQESAIVSTEDSRVYNLMHIGYPRSIAAVSSEDCSYDFKKRAGIPVPRCIISLIEASTPPSHRQASSLTPISQIKYFTINSNIDINLSRINFEINY
ncbi:hypothetical protein DID88_008899 [Monilinia fructigena]|uniref:Uncharacterized protein n=1 Tax=Monilinia fructigena TaxID=38457 RepID=A0A395J6R1_9HELO|nr:hypothetical protein DID88_008899 [Monilinia fructigena]